LSGKDGGLIKASRLKVRQPGSGDDSPLIDIGSVGKVDMINPHIVQVLDNSGYIPIVAPIGVGEQGEPYNINADLVAGEVAAALKAEKLIVLTDVEGILDEQKALISSLKRADIAKLIEQGVISEGMLPKVEACLTALDGGVRKAHIIDGRQDHSLLLEVFTNRGIGTEIVAY
jgi:acetylglutamate kinase